MKGLIPAKFVSLRGSTNIGSWSTRNLDALRDTCELHLHEETGGVLVTTRDGCHYLPAMSIDSVDLVNPLQTSSVTPPSNTSAKEVTKSLPQTANLADKVLEELGTHPVTKSQRRKRN